jgi:hypothetical protein
MVSRSSPGQFGRGPHHANRLYSRSLRSVHTPTSGSVRRTPDRAQRLYLEELRRWHGDGSHSESTPDTSRWRPDQLEGRHMDRAVQPRQLSGVRVGVSGFATGVSDRNDRFDSSEDRAQSQSKWRVERFSLCHQPCSGRNWNGYA